MLFKFCKFFSLVAVLALLVAPASAAVIFDEDFNDSNVWVDGEATANDDWAGQSNTIVNTANSTATTTNAWVGVSNVNGAKSAAPGTKMTVTGHFQFQNLGGDAAGETGALDNATLGQFGLGTTDDMGSVRRLGNGSAESMTAAMTKQAGQITVRPNGAFGDGQGDFVVTNADVGFDFGVDGLTPDSSDLLELVYMVTKSATPDQWDVMVSLTNLDTNTLLGTGSAVTTNPNTYDPATAIPGATENLHAGWSVLGNSVYPPAGGRGGPLSGFAVDRIILDAEIIPEPASMALACVSCLAIAGLRRNR